MKERVLENLHEFSKEDILDEPSSIFQDLQIELQLEAEELHRRSIKILNRILYNYDFFDILTIDKFNHRLIRTFALDRKSTRLNSSHVKISYAVFCLKKK